MSKKVIFLDRDGTINVDHGYVFEQKLWAWTPGAIEGMKLLQEAGFVLTVITNQSGIAQGLYTEADMQALHAYMLAELEKQGVRLAAIAFCPHNREQDNCDCRKPKTGMATQIEKEIGEIDYQNSWTIGDKEADVGFGKNTGTHTALVKSQYWKETQLTQKPDLIVDNLLEAAKYITQN